MRSLTLAIRYEVLLSFRLLILLLLLSRCYDDQSYTYRLVLLAFPLLFIIILAILIEVNRAPFDLVEGESELVSGYNIEFSGVLFTLIFLSEYGITLLLVVIVISLFISGVLSVVVIALTILLVLGIRTMYPRVRYDSMMSLL
jgi:NADH:ubiquinone oxidoreductase subunit H